LLLSTNDVPGGAIGFASVSEMDELIGRRIPYPVALLEDRAAIYYQISRLPMMMWLIYLRAQHKTASSRINLTPVYGGFFMPIPASLTIGQLAEIKPDL
jgi:hypothetical protein